MSTTPSPVLTSQLPGVTPTVLLVDDDPLQAHVHRTILERQFSDVERACDAADAFILVEEGRLADKLGLVLVALNRPGLGGPAFVSELTQRLPSVPILVLGRGESPSLYSGENVRVLARAVSSNEILAVSREMIENSTSRPA